MTKRGVPCRAFAGQKTDHLGAGRCAYHGGATPNGRKHALALEAKQRMVAMSVPVENAQPHIVLLQELSMSAGHVGWVRGEIAALDPAEVGSERSKVLLTRYDQERDRLARIAKACSDAGVDEARIQIEQAQTVLVVRAITDAAKEAGIPARYVSALGPALRKQMALLAGDGAAVEQADARVVELRERIAEQEAEAVEKAAQKYAGLVPADELDRPLPA